MTVNYCYIVYYTYQGVDQSAEMYYIILSPGTYYLCNNIRILQP